MTDLVLCYKLMHGYTDCDFSSFFQLADYNSTRGHGYKLAKKFSCVSVHKYNFENRIVSVWNNLPKEIVDAESIEKFNMLLSNASLDSFLIIN